MYKEERDVVRDEENRRMWHGEVWGVQDTSKRRDRKKGKASAWK